MEVTKPKDNIQIYVGYHITLLKKEMNNKHPDWLVLTNCFLEILDALHLIIRQYSPLSMHRDNCCCYTFLFQHFQDILFLEEYINSSISEDITVHQTSCWISRTHKKYSKLHEVLTRRRRNSNGLMWTYTPPPVIQSTPSNTFF